MNYKTISVGLLIIVADIILIAVGHHTIFLLMIGSFMLGFGFAETV